MKKLLAGILLGALALTGCSSGLGASVSTAVDELVLVYNAGSMEDKTFSKCVAPGTRVGVDGNDFTFSYRAGHRTFDFKDGDNAEMPPIEVTTRDKLKLQISGNVQFAFNTRCDIARQFHDRIGRSKQAYYQDTNHPVDDDASGAAGDSTGWVKTLLLFMQPQVVTAVRSEALKYDSAEILDGATRAGDSKPALQMIAEKAGAAFSAGLINAVKGPYFCDPTYIAPILLDGEETDKEVKAKNDVLRASVPCGSPQFVLIPPTTPQAIAEQAEKTATALQREKAAKADFAAKQAELAADMLYIDKLGKDNWTQLEIIERLTKSEKVRDIYLVPGGNGFSVRPSQ